MPFAPFLKEVTRTFSETGVLLDGVRSRDGRGLFLMFSTFDEAAAL
jgi:hypothetical protein